MARTLDDWLDAYVKYTANTEPRVSYRTWVAISTIASVLQRKCYLQWGSEIWFPNFYIILTGPPAARKGTAMRPARRLLETLGLYIAADESSRQKLICRILERVASVNTDERLGYAHCSITINASELTVFLNKADEQLIPSLCKWYDCENRFVYETISRETQHITNIWVNLLGATTPRNLQTALPLEAFGSGLISRTLFVYEEDKDKIIIFPRLDASLEEPLIHDLEEIQTIAGKFKVAPRIKGEEDVVEAYTKWRYQTEEHPTVTDPRFEDYNQRRPTHLWKLCIVSSASRSNDRRITLGDFHRAVNLLDTLESKMVHAFKGIGQYSLAGIQARIMRCIAQQKTITRGELLQRYHMEVSSAQLGEILGTLGEMGFCKIDLIYNNVIHIPEKERKEP